MNIIKTKVIFSPKMLFRLCLLGTMFLLLFHSCITEKDIKVRYQEASWIAVTTTFGRFSVSVKPTLLASPIIGGGAIYPIPMNALMARRSGLLDGSNHGGPNHWKVNLEKAYPELILSRELVPEVIQFFGLELNPPGAGLRHKEGVISWRGIPSSLQSGWICGHSEEQ